MPSIRNWFETNFTHKTQNIGNKNKDLNFESDPNKLRNFFVKEVFEIFTLCDYFLNTKNKKNTLSVILNLEKVIVQNDFYRIMDILNGFLYATKGKIKKVSPKIYLISI